MRRALIGPAALFFFGLAWSVLAHAKWIGWVCLSVAAALGALFPRAVQERLPQLELERGAGGSGWTLHLRPPIRTGRRRLKSETLAAVGDLRKYRDAHPQSTTTQRIQAFQAEVDLLTSAGNDEEYRRRWTELRNRESDEAEARDHMFQSEFGGRLRYPFGEYRRRGFLDRSEHNLALWFAEHDGRLEDTAQKLEELALRL